MMENYTHPTTVRWLSDVQNKQLIKHADLLDYDFYDDLSSWIFQSPVSALFHTHGPSLPPLLSNYIFSDLNTS